MPEVPEASSSGWAWRKTIVAIPQSCPSAPDVPRHRVPRMGHVTDRSAAVAELVASLPEGVVATTPEALEKYRQDWAHDPGAGMPCAAVRAELAEHVQPAVRWAASHGIPVVPRGAGSGLSGGASAVEGGLVISLERMTAIEIDPAAALRRRRARRLQRLGQAGRRRARPLVPARPQLVRDLLHRGQRRDQRGRAVLREVRRHD